MNAIFTFNLDNCEDEERMMHFVNGSNYACAIIELDSWLRSEYKYSDRESIPPDEVREKLRQILVDNKIDVETLF